MNVILYGAVSFKGGTVPVLFLFGQGGNAPLRVFAKYLKNDLTDLHQTLRPLRLLYRSSFEVKNLGIGHYCCYGNQLMGECLARKHEQSGKVS